MSSYCTSIIYAGSTEGLMYLADKIAYPPLWETYRKDFDTLGTRGLFNIGDISEITPELIEKAHKIVEYYVGSLENINEEHLHGIALMFTDSGFQYGNILLGVSRCVMECHGSLRFLIFSIVLSYIPGTHKTINYLVEHGVTVFPYILNYTGQFSFTQAFTGFTVNETFGVCHGDDLIYMFDPLADLGIRLAPFI